MAKKGTTGIFGLCFVKQGAGEGESWLLLATILCPRQDKDVIKDSTFVLFSLPSLYFWRA